MYTPGALYHLDLDFHRFSYLPGIERQWPCFAASEACGQSLQLPQRQVFGKFQTLRSCKSFEKSHRQISFGIYIHTSSESLATATTQLSHGSWAVFAASTTRSFVRLRLESQQLSYFARSLLQPTRFLGQVLLCSTA